MGLGYYPAAIPAEGAMLCEGCGYILDGLPNGAKCPECAKQMDESLPDLRRPPAWEERGAFWETTREVIFRPKRFFRSLNTRGELKRSGGFARWHWIFVALLLTFTEWLQLSWIDFAPLSEDFELAGAGAEVIIYAVLTLGVLVGTTKLAA